MGISFGSTYLNIAQELLSVNPEAHDVVELAKTYHMEIFITNELKGKEYAWLYVLNQSGYNWVEKKRKQNSNIKYQLFLNVETATEKLEWIAYYSVLAGLCEKNMISASFLEHWTSGTRENRDNIWHKIALCLLAPPEKIEASEIHYSADCEEDVSEISIKFGMSLKNAKKRLRLGKEYPFRSLPMEMKESEVEKL